jgi:hypothetical protein
MSLNHAPLHIKLDCRGKWNLKMNYGLGEVSTCCFKQQLVWVIYTGRYSFRNFNLLKVKYIANV